MKSYDLELFADYFQFYLQDEAADAPMRAAYTQQLMQSFVGDVVDQFESGVREEIGASIDEKRFQAFHNNE